MNPQKAKDFIKPTADQLGIDEELVKELVDAYWKEVRLTLSKGTEPVVYVKNLVTFVVKPLALDDKILAKEGILENLDKTNFRNFAIAKSVETDLEHLRLLKQKHKELDNLKDQHKKKRDVYNMEKSKADSGRDLE